MNYFVLCSACTTFATMKRLDKTYWSALVLLSVYLPMVVMSSLDFHCEWEDNDELCRECLEHIVHNGHITAMKTHQDCPLCAFRNNVYQPAEEQVFFFIPTETCLTIESDYPALTLGYTTHQNTRAPPITSCV